MGTLLSFESVPKAKNLTKKNTTTKLSELAFKMDDPRLEWLSCVLKSSINVPKKAFLKHLNTDRNEDAIDDFFNVEQRRTLITNSKTLDTYFSGQLNEESPNPKRLNTRKKSPT